mgnify:CR=1 FL=1
MMPETAGTRDAFIGTDVICELNMVAADVLGYYFFE